MIGGDNNGARQRPDARLLDELASIGVHFKSIASTSHIKVMPADAFRIILRHLAADYPANVKEAMARALGRKEARAVIWPDVIALYKSLPEGKSGDNVKDGVAASLQAMATPSDLETVIDLIQDRNNGPSRIFFILNLSRSKDQRAVEALVHLRDDPDLKKEIEFRLKGKLRRVDSSDKSKGN